MRSNKRYVWILAFAEVIKELWSEDSSDRVVNTVSLKSQIQRFAPRFMGYAQQDAQEFLRYLLEGLHEDVNRVIEKPKPILTEIDDKLRYETFYLLGIYTECLFLCYFFEHWLVSAIRSLSSY